MGSRVGGIYLEPRICGDFAIYRDQFHLGSVVMVSRVGLYLESRICGE